MTKINQIIGPRWFEVIRDRIALIIKDELLNQFNLSGNPIVNATVFSERTIPVNKSELPLVNVMLAAGDFDNYKQLEKDGLYSFNIDVFHFAEGTNVERGDQLSINNLHRLLGVIDYILSDPQYSFLGFSVPSISRVQVEDFKISDPTEGQRSENVSMGRLVLTVRVNESNEPVEPSVLGDFITEVKIFNTEKGYLFSGENEPSPPPIPPDCPTVFDYNLNVNGTFIEVVQLDVQEDINLILF